MKVEKQVNSIYDLADEAGVSYATVSRVLNGRGRTSEGARQKVMAVAEKFNFRPKMQARRKTIALVLNSANLSLDSEYYVTLTSCLVKQLSLHDLCVEFYSAHNVSRLRGAHIDGIVCLPWNSQSMELLESLPENVPQVIPNAFGPECCSTVMSDHYQSGRMAADVLLKNGHVSAGFIISGLQTKANAERARGFRERFAEDGHEITPRLLCDLADLSVLDAVERILREKATAIFLASEGKTQAFAAALRRLGIKIPDDLSVVAMESWELSRFQDPPYTTIQQPYELIAAKTINLLLNQIASGDHSPEHLLLDNLFIERDSVKKLQLDKPEGISL